MGRIADNAATADEPPPYVFTNKVDTVLEDLDDDDDRAVVLGWLRSRMSEEELEQRLLAHGVLVSDTTIRRWRKYQAKGLGREWVA